MVVLANPNGQIGKLLPLASGDFTVVSLGNESEFYVNVHLEGNCRQFGLEKSRNV